MACSLAEREAGQGVAIVDVDVFGKYSSSELNGGGVRCTFAHAEHGGVCVNSGCVLDTENCDLGFANNTEKEKAHDRAHGCPGEDHPR